MKNKTEKLCVCQICKWYFDDVCFKNHRKNKKAKNCKDFKKNNVKECIFLLEKLFGENGILVRKKENNEKK